MVVSYGGISSSEEENQRQEDGSEVMQTEEGLSDVGSRIKQRDQQHKNAVIMGKYYHARTDLVHKNAVIMGKCYHARADPVHY